MKKMDNAMLNPIYPAGQSRLLSWMGMSINHHAWSGRMALSMEHKLTGILKIHTHCITLGL